MCIRDSLHDMYPGRVLPLIQDYFDVQRAFGVCIHNLYGNVGQKPCHLFDLIRADLCDHFQFPGGVAGYDTSCGGSFQPLLIPRIRDDNCLLYTSRCV